MTPALDVRSRLRATRAGQRAAADLSPTITKVKVAQRRKLGTMLGADQARLRKLNPYMSQEFGASAIARSIAKQKSFGALDVLTSQGDVLTRSMTNAITAAAGPLAAQQTARSRLLLTGEHTWATRPFITPRTRDTISEVARTALAGLAPQIDVKALGAAAGAGRFDKGAYRGLTSGMFGPAARDTFPSFAPQIDKTAIAALSGVAGFKSPAYAGMVSQISRGAFADFRMPLIDAKALAGYTALRGFDKAALGILPRIDVGAVAGLAAFGGVERARVAALAGSYFDRAGWGDIAGRTLARQAFAEGAFVDDGFSRADEAPSVIVPAKRGDLLSLLGIESHWDAFVLAARLAAVDFTGQFFVLATTGEEIPREITRASEMVIAWIYVILAMMQRREEASRE